MVSMAVDQGISTVPRIVHCIGFDLSRRRAFLGSSLLRPPPTPRLLSIPALIDFAVFVRLMILKTDIACYNCESQATDVTTWQNDCRGWLKKGILCRISLGSL